MLQGFIVFTLYLDSLFVVFILEQLEGYRGYTTEVPCHLIPGIW
jgi:hypothetical protein